MTIGIIGGSGLYQLAGSGERILLETPFGKPSGAYFKFKFGSHDEVIFLARHGEGHVHSPSEVNYRANVYGFKKLGARTLVSISAVGSMQPEIQPGHFVLPDQYIDWTRGMRPNSFFGNGVVGHVPLADPTCATLSNYLFSRSADLGVKVHRGGTYVCIEGPQFSTRAESHLFRSWKLPTGPVSVIGMTALPEAKLAREAGLCYQTIAMATDYDCWDSSHNAVTLEAILKVMHANVGTVQKFVSLLFSSPFPACANQCHTLMKTAGVTPKEYWPKSRAEELEVILS